MAKRTITLEAVGGQFDDDEVVEAVDIIVTVLTFIGGQVAMGVTRDEKPGGMYVPAALHIQYDTFVPANHLDREDAHQEGKLFEEEAVPGTVVPTEDPGEEEADGKGEDTARDFASKTPAAIER